MPDIYMDVDTAVTISANRIPLVDNTDFKTIEEAVAWNAAGMDLNWNFVTSAGVITQTNVTPTTGGDYDWTHVGNGMYKIEMTAVGGASANNDTEGYGWFSGVCTGVLPWVSPTIGFRAAGLNDLLCDNAYSATRGLAGTAVPAAAADGVGGLPISDAGGLDLDTQLAATNEVTAARMGALTDWIDGGRLDLLLDAIPTTAMRGTDNAALAATALSTATWTNARAGYLDNINGHTAQTGDSFARLGAPAGASVSVDIAAVPTLGEMTAAFTEIKGATWAGATDTFEAIRDRGDAAWVTGAGGDATAATQATIITHLTDIKGGTWAATDSLESIRDRGDAAWTTGAGGDATAATQATIVTHLTDIKGATFVGATDSNEAIRDRGDAAWTTGVAGAILQVRAESDFIIAESE